MREEVGRGAMWRGKGRKWKVRENNVKIGGGGRGEGEGEGGGGSGEGGGEGGGERGGI